EVPSIGPKGSELLLFFGRRCRAEAASELGIFFGDPLQEAARELRSIEQLPLESVHVALDALVQALAGFQVLAILPQQHGQVIQRRIAGLLESAPLRRRGLRHPLDEGHRLAVFADERLANDATLARE